MSITITDKENEDLFCEVAPSLVREIVARHKAEAKREVEEVITTLARDLGYITKD